MNKAVNETDMFTTSCQIWFDGTSYYVVACHQYYDEEFEFITNGVTPEGELVDSGYRQGNVSAITDSLVDYGSASTLILRGWGNLFPTIEE